MIPTTDPTLGIISQRIDSDLQAFLAAGGQIDTIPVGAMAETGWTAKQRCNPQVTTSARKLAEKAEFARREEERQRKAAEKPAKAPPPPKPPRPKIIAQAGTFTEAVLQAVRDGFDTAPAIAEHTGQIRAAVSVRLGRLKAAGLVTSRGMSHAARWRIAR